MYYHIIRILSLLSVVQGLDRSCTYLCKSLGKRSIKLEDSDCKSSPVEKIKEDRRVEHLSSVELTDNGVYYEPSEVSPFQGTFATKLFHISNPMFNSFKTFQKRIKKEFDLKNNNHFNIPNAALGEADDPGHDIVVSLTKTESGKLASYLDLDIQESVYSERSSQSIESIENLKLAEQNLVECLNHHILENTKSGISNEFHNMLNEEQIKPYQVLSTDYVKAKLRKDCSHIASLVKKHLHEIKEGMPTRKQSLRSANNMNDKEISRNGTVINNSTYNDAAISTMESFNFGDNILPSIVEDVTESAYTNDKKNPIKEQSNIPEQNKNNNNIDKNERDKNISTIFVSGDQTKDNSSTAIEFHSDYENSTNTMFTSDLNFMYTEVTQHDSMIEVTQTTDTPFENNGFNIILDLDTSSSMYIENEKRINDTELPSEIDLNVSKQINKENTSFYEIGIINNVTNAVPDVEDSTVTLITQTSLNNHKDQAFMDDSIFPTDILPFSGTTLNTKGPPEYSETDIEIPRIITREYKNTTKSSISGIEDMPNNDFAHNSNNIYIATKTKNTTQGNIQSSDLQSNTEIMNTIKSHSHNKSLNHHIQFDISGRLYFVYDKELIPAHFVQDKYGEISMSIDSTTLCNKLLETKKNKSILLGTLCDYIKKKEADCTDT